MQCALVKRSRSRCKSSRNCVDTGYLVDKNKINFCTTCFIPHFICDMTEGGLFLLAIIFISKTSLCLGDDYYYAHSIPGYNNLNEVDDSYDYNYDEYGYDYDFESPKKEGMKNNQTLKSLFNR